MLSYPSIDRPQGLGTIHSGLAGGSLRQLMLLVSVVLGLAGCQAALDRTDRQVYGLIAERQREALGVEADLAIGRDDASPRPGSRAYAFVPRPVDPAMPSAFAGSATTQAAGQDDAGDPNAAGEASGQAQRPSLTFTLRDCLRCAFMHARDFQDAKEDLYLKALDLTLERHLWTPQWVATLSGDYNYVRDFDRTMEAVANVAVTQRLPYGGEVTAKVIDTLVRDIGQHVTTTESGQYIVETSLPLLRGAGRVAYESRYQAERDLVYAVRAFERFRRAFGVSIASDVFRLLEFKQRIVNAELSAEGNRDNHERTVALFQAGRAISLDVQRAQQQLLSARSAVINAEENYASSLDAFKVTLGIPLDTPLVLKDEALGALEHAVSEDDAIGVALAFRLDLVTLQDRIDDAYRRVRVARNSLLPDLEIGGRMTHTTESDILDLTGTENGRTEWQGSVTLQVPLDRKAERNQYRRRQIGLQQSKRAHDLGSDRVRQEVRSALRRIEQAQANLKIQEMGVQLAMDRRAYAELSFQEGLVDNRDVVDAERDLLDARNGYASAEAELRVAVLQLRRDTGTMRIDSEGFFVGLETAKQADQPELEPGS